MYTRILIPTDGSELSNKAVQYGIALAKTVDAKVVVLTVQPPFRQVDDPDGLGEESNSYAQRMERCAAEVLNPAAEAATCAGVACETVHVAHEHIYRAIIDTANSKACDLIVMASHGRKGMAAILLGSETIKVLTHCSIPVLVHRDPHLSAAQLLTALS
jgi:nucleotide-binding universal stress UspA family protein